MVAVAASDSAGRVEVLGLPVDPLPRTSVWREIEQAVGEPWDGCCRHLVTLNPEYVMAAQRDEAFARAIRSADLVTADGVGVALAARLERRSRERGLRRVTGVEILGWLAGLSGQAKAPLFLLGGAPGVAAAAAAELRKTHPEAVIAGTWGEGTPAPQDDQESLRRIGASGARVVAVAYGAPGQVFWIDRNRQSLADAGVRLAIGVGGSLDFVAGRVPRAPVVVRRVGLEWLYRLIREPWRWRRQLVLPVFAVLVVKEQIERLLNR